MILDFENMFSKDQAVTATGTSTNIIDLGPGDAGPSERLSLFVTADPAFTSTGTLVVTLQSADDKAMASPDTPISFSLSNAQLLAGGKLIASRLPHGCKRYLSLNYTVTGTIADGKLTAGLVWDVQAEKPIPTGPSGI